MNNDIISRSALKKAFEDTVCIEPMPYAFVKQIIDNAPTVEQNWRFYYDHGYAQAKRDFERPHGKWEQVSSQVVHCSCCNKNSIDMSTYVKMNYCPNCGAKMDGKEADNEQ